MNSRSDCTVLLDFVVCPDDREALRPDRDGLRCRACGRLYAKTSDAYWDFRPAKPLEKACEFGAAYFSAYRDLFAREAGDFSGGAPWGAAEHNPIAWVEKRERHRDTVWRLIQSVSSTSTRSVLVDVSAGAGFYSIALAPYFQYVLHCDLCVTNLAYASKQSLQLGITNIMFLRADYLALPFRRSASHLLCLDSLIRGECHELHVLQQIAGSLHSSGFAVVDFHNWWHNPFRRLGLFPDNFHNNRSYSRREVEALLRAAHLDTKQYKGFVQEADSNSKLEAISSRVLPPTRFLYLVQSAAEASH